MDNVKNIEESWGISEVKEGVMPLSNLELVLLGAIVNEWIAVYQAGVLPKMDEDAYPVFDSLMEKMADLAGEIVVPYVTDAVREAANAYMKDSSPPASNGGDLFIPGV